VIRSVAALTDTSAGSPRLRLPLPSSAPLVGAAWAEGGKVRGHPHPQPLSRAAGEGGAGSVDSVSLTDAGAGSPRLRLPLPSSAPLVGAAGVEGGRCGGTLTPSPSPALRERGELVRGLGIVDRHQRRIATATLTSPLFRSLGGSGMGGRGKVRGHPHPQPLSRAAGAG
jgi:hypothetical protein